MIAAGALRRGLAVAGLAAALAVTGAALTHGLREKPESKVAGVTAPCTSCDARHARLNNLKVASRAGQE